MERERIPASDWKVARHYNRFQLSRPMMRICMLTAILKARNQHGSGPIRNRTGNRRQSSQIKRPQSRPCHDREEYPSLAQHIARCFKRERGMKARITEEDFLRAEVDWKEFCARQEAEHDLAKLEILPPRPMRFWARLWRAIKEAV